MVLVKPSDLFPMIGPDEFEALKRDIAEHGQREPILLVDGEVVDGRNRMRACEELGVEPKVENLTAAEAGDVFALVMSLNFHRRHLKPHEKGAALAAWLEHRGGGKQKAGRPKTESAHDGPISVTKAAATLNIPKATAQRHLQAAEDYKAAAPQLRAKVDAGEITPKKARELTEREAYREVIASAASATAPESERHLEELSASTSATKFACIYADPPWQYGNQGTRAATSNHYATMSVDDICGMPIRDMAAEDAHLHLWTTNAFLFEAKRVMEAWGFTYKSCFVWVKPQMGLGNYWRVSHEFLLFGVRGRCPFLARDEMSWAELPRGRHSAKPDEIRKTIERVSPGPRLELFARDRHEGWSVFGNQIQPAPQ